MVLNRKIVKNWVFVLDSWQANVTYQSSSGESTSTSPTLCASTFHTATTRLPWSLFLGPCSQEWQKKALRSERKRFFSNVALSHMKKCSFFFRNVISCEAYCANINVPTLEEAFCRDTWQNHVLFTRARGVNRSWFCRYYMSLQHSESFVYHHLTKMHGL